MKKELQVLMIEDAAPDMELVSHTLRAAGLRFQARRVDSREAFVCELETRRPDVILSDHGVPGFDGFAALVVARNRCPEVPFIFVTGAPDEAAREETLSSGADGYVLKSNLHLLPAAIERAMRGASERVQQPHTEAGLRLAQL